MVWYGMVWYGMVWYHAQIRMMFVFSLFTEYLIHCFDVNIKVIHHNMHQSAHYFFESEAACENFLYNSSIQLRNNGYAYGTVPTKEVCGHIVYG